MYYQTKSNLDTIFEKVGLKKDILNYRDVLIKINLARPPAENHPRTDTKLLENTLLYILNLGGKPVICESADGYLTKNLGDIGLMPLIEKYNIGFFDIDEEKAFKVKVGGQVHYIPEKFKDFPLRIALPCASKRESSIFSNNIKLFIGAIPRRFYQKPGLGNWRAKIHDNLHQSVCNVFLAIRKKTPFRYYINGGNSYSVGKGNFQIDNIYIGDDALELDRVILKEYFPEIAVPEYIHPVAREIKKILE